MQLSIYSPETPAGVSSQQQKKDIKGKNESTSGIPWLTKLWQKQISGSGGTEPHRNGAHLFEVIWLPLHLSAAVRTSLLFWASGRLCSIFPGAFLMLFLLSLYSKGLSFVFYLVALIVGPSLLPPPFLHTRNLSSVWLKVVFSFYPINLFSSSMKKTFVIEFCQHLITINIIKTTRLLIRVLFSNSVTFDLCDSSCLLSMFWSPTCALKYLDRLTRQHCGSFSPLGSDFRAKSRSFGLVFPQLELLQLLCFLFPLVAL